ncbi:hypothetical protein SprV_0501835600 [Sparganum proliferum]
MMLAYLIAFPVAAEVYVPVFYKLELSSSHEYLEMRFNRSLRWIVTVVFAFQMIIYIAVVLYAPSLALSQATGWDVNAAIIATGLLATFYTAIGGIKAVVWTDLIQMCVMFIGFIMIIAIGAAQLGGLDNIVQIAKEGKRLDVFNFDFNPFVRHSFWALTFGGAGMVLSIYATNQTSVQRYLACKDLKTTRTAIHLNLPLNIVFMTLQCLGGLVSYATFVGCDPKLAGETTASDQVLPYLIMKLFNHIPVVRGIFISSILAAALSTLSSGINSIAGVIVEDVVMEIIFLCRPGTSISQRKLTFFARFLAVLIGVITIGVAFLLSIVPSGVLQISFSIFGAIGGPILTVFTLGILMPFVNQWGGLVGFLASLATGLTLTIGSIFSTYRQIPEVPLTNANCSGNASVILTSILRGTNVTASNDIPFNFFNLSYLYYSPVCLIVGVIIGSLVSFATGMSTKRPVSHSLLAWQAVSLYSHLPHCVAPQSTPEPVTSAHKAKLTTLVKEDPDDKLKGEEGFKDDEGSATASVLSNTYTF